MIAQDSVANVGRFSGRSLENTLLHLVDDVEPRWRGARHCHGHEDEGRMITEAMERFSADGRSTASRPLADGRWLFWPALPRRWRRRCGRPRSRGRPRAHSAGSSRRIRIDLVVRKVWNAAAVDAGSDDIDPFASAIPDQIIICCWMAVSPGGVAVWRWDTIFPDRANLWIKSPLPIERTIFSANLVVVLFLVGLIAIDVNAASSILFPLVVELPSTLFFSSRDPAVDALGVVVASAFSFFAVFSVLASGWRCCRRAPSARGSPYVRALVVVYLVTLLCTDSFALPDLRRLPGSPPAWTRPVAFVLVSGAPPVAAGARGSYVISTWEFGYARVRGGDRDCVCVYAVGYQRHFVALREISAKARPLNTPRKNRG